MGAFFLKIWKPLAAKLLIGSQKVRRCKNGTDLLYRQASMVGIVYRAPAVDEKVWFFVCMCLSVCFLSRFGMTKLVITETLWSSVIFRSIMVSLRTGRFVVVHLYSTFSVDPQNFFLGANLYKKMRLYAIFEAVGPHFLSQNGEIWYEGADPGLPPPSQIL